MRPVQPAGLPAERARGGAAIRARARPDPWEAFPSQAGAFLLAVVVALGVLAPLARLAVGEPFEPGIAVAVMLVGGPFAAGPALLAAAAMRSWRNARRDSPFAIAALAAVAILGSGAWMWQAPPPGHLVAVAVAAGLPVGGALALAAAARTRRTAPALLGLAAGLLLAVLSLPLLFLFADDAGGAAPMVVAAMLAVATLAGAAAYALTDPRRAGVAPPARPRGAGR